MDKKKKQLIWKQLCWRKNDSNLACQLFTEPPMGSLDVDKDHLKVTIKLKQFFADDTKSSLSIRSARSGLILLLQEMKFINNVDSTEQNGYTSNLMISSSVDGNIHLSKKCMSSVGYKIHTYMYMHDKSVSLIS